MSTSNKHTPAHTHTYTHTVAMLTGGWALTAIWRWHSSDITHWASCVHLLPHPASTATSMTCFLLLRLKSHHSPMAPNEYQPLLLFVWLGCQWQTYSLSICSSAPTGCLSRSSIPHPAPWRSVDTPSITLPSPRLLRGPVNSALLSCSSSWWFTVLLHKMTEGISQCLNTEQPYYSQMRRGLCRMADAVRLLC